MIKTIHIKSEGITCSFEMNVSSPEELKEAQTKRIQKAIDKINGTFFCEVCDFKLPAHMNGWTKATSNTDPILCIMCFIEKDETFRSLSK